MINTIEHIKIFIDPHGTQICPQKTKIYINLKYSGHGTSRFSLRKNQRVTVIITYLQTSVQPLKTLKICKHEFLANVYLEAAVFKQDKAIFVSGSNTLQNFFYFYFLLTVPALIKSVNFHTTVTVLL